MEERKAKDLKTLSVEDMYAELEKKIAEALPSADLARIRAAFELAKAAHEGQKRRDGSPYITHVIAAAEICADFGLDEDSIVAALLHDTVEDTSVSHEDIAKKFGSAVSDLVDGVTKLTRVQYTSKEEEQMENLRKMLMAMAKDIRVILIKMADRLHNMRTMAYQTPDKQRTKSLETMEIYAPIAHRLGMQRVTWELEDLSLFYLDPIAYAEINEAVSKRMGALEGFMGKVEDHIKEHLAENGITASVYGRVKHTYSIYRKLYAQNRDLSEIFDLCAFRVIVETLADCYNVLGLIHDMYRPVPGRFKDYISTPKPNMYQSLHTTVIGAEGIPFEVQIRTREMHHTAEYGIAAHWKYKTGEIGVRSGDEEKFAWIRRLLESQNDSDAQDFFHDLRIDMFSDEVFVFSPKGDVINLPVGATPIDFAYAIHSGVGNSMIGCQVNGRIVPFDRVLQNGDIVEVITSKSAPGPSRDWMKLAKSGTARAKIKQWFKRERREENILRGREMFEQELKHAGISQADASDEKLLLQAARKLSTSSVDEMYAAIGYGGLTSTRAVNRFKDELQKAQKTAAPKTALDRITAQTERRVQQPSTKAVHGVLVEGLDNCLIKFSRCCTPIPGDDIVGFITRGFGVSVHRKDCENFLKSSRDETEKGRWINVSWSSETTDPYEATLNIYARERNGLVMDIATVLNLVNAKVRSLNARNIGDNRASVSITLAVKDLAGLRLVMAKLAAVPSVTAVVRAGETGRYYADLREPEI